jgi:hypothetical protein
MIRICVLLVSSISWKMTHPVLGFLVNRTDDGWINKIWSSCQRLKLLELRKWHLLCCPGQNGKYRLPSSAHRYANIHLQDTVSLSSHLPGSFPEVTRIVAYIFWVVHEWKQRGIEHEKIAHEIYTTRRIYHILWKHCKLRTRKNEQLIRNEVISCYHLVMWDGPGQILLMIRAFV